MSIIGCDLHSRYQVIALVETETGEMVTRRLEHENGEARAFYATLPKPSLIGMEATGYTQWFERLVAELGHELWVGDPARDSGPRRAAAEDRHAGRRAPAGFAADEALPARLGADAGGARRAATAEAPPQAGADADLGAKPVALPGHEPGRVPEAEAVERAGPSRARRAELGPVGEPATERVAGAAGPARAADRRARW